MHVVVVTGGSAGIGKATAIEAGRQGLGVILTYAHRATEATDTVQLIEAAGGSAAALHLDLGETASFGEFRNRLAATLETKWGTDRLHGLVNNAGIGGGTAFEDLSEETFDLFHRILFKGPYFLTQHLIALMDSGGAIVNVGSTSAVGGSAEVGYSHYAGHKAAMHTVTRYWAKELSPRQIRVNAVAPGTTRTRIANDSFSQYPELATTLGSGLPLGRIGEPEDIGRVITFLLNPDSGWITGETIEVSGGQGL